MSVFKLVTTDVFAWWCSGALNTLPIITESLLPNHWLILCWYCVVLSCVNSFELEVILKTCGMCLIIWDKTWILNCPDVLSRLIRESHSNPHRRRKAAGLLRFWSIHSPLQNDPWSVLWIILMTSFQNVVVRQQYNSIYFIPAVGQCSLSKGGVGGGFPHFDNDKAILAITNK